MQYYLRAIYTGIYQIFGGSEILLSIIGSTIVINAAFWGTNSIFMLADLTGRPKWLLRYKIQPDKNRPVDRDLWWQAVKTALINLVFLNLVFGYFFMYTGQKMFGCSFKPEDIPGLPRILLDCFVCWLVQGVGFYYAHRIFHHPLLYKYIHKKHHTWKAPIGIAAVYAHPLEQLIVNGSPNFVGSMLMRSHIMTFWIWITYVMVDTVLGHSGYHLPLQKSPEFHDFHHLKCHCNYGGFEFLDWLHGTDDLFRNTVQSERNKILYGLTPLSESVPDKKKE